MSADRRTFLGGSMAVLAAAGVSPPVKPTLAWPSAERFPVWPGHPPGTPSKPIIPNSTNTNGGSGHELWLRGIAIAEVQVFRPAQPDGSALLIIPGGGYEFLSVENEGLDPASCFVTHGTTVFVLAYRLPVDGWLDRSIVPLQDAQRTMRLIRSRAAHYGIDPKRLGVLGFSAGGHLAADLAVSYDETHYPTVDEADAQSARPAFLGLIYPVISLDTKISEGSSAPSLLGPNPLPALIHARSPALHVSAATPPSFLVAAFDDGLVHIDNSPLWIDACRKAGVSVEAHLLAEGGHGFGTHLPPDNPGSRWPELFALWLRKHGG